MSKTRERATWHLKEFDRPLLVAAHFGFTPIATPKISQSDIDATQDCGEDPHYSAAEKMAFIRSYIEKELHALPHPLGFSYKRGKSHVLEVVGFPAGLAEAILIRTTLSILVEEGFKHLVVDVNCIGDKESIAVYERELANYVRKSGATLSDEFKKELKKDIFNLIRSSTPDIDTLRLAAPTSIAYLSTQSRAHFKEVLEYIEALDIEFRLAPELVGHKNYCSHTIFNIKNSVDGKEEVLAVGYSYPRLGKRAGLKKEVPFSGVTIFSGHKPSGAKKARKDLPKSKFHLIQLGREAKIKTLSVIEMLRKERISVHHLIGKDKLAVQLSNAESLGVPYLLIIGHKEALEDTVTVRNTSTRSQYTISAEELPGFLKGLPM